MANRVYTAPRVGETALSGFAVTPHDTNTFDRMPRGLYIGGAGDVKVRTSERVDLTFTAVPAGQILPIKVDRVLSSGTTATNIVALY